MKRTLIITVLLMLSTLVMAQNKKVALLEPLNGDKTAGVKLIELNMVRGELRKAISSQMGYQAFTRTDIDQLMKEHNFQNSGMVADAQRAKIGEMSGANYICVSTLTKSNTEFYLEAYLIDVETGEISNPATQYGILKDGTYANLYQICQDLAQELIGYVGSSGGNSYTNGNSYSSQGAATLTFTVGGVNFEMIKVETGTFIMGCTSEQGGDCDSDESPYHRVTISQEYYIGKFEVTQELYEAVMGTNPSNWKAFDRPVESVSWNDAMEFCAELSRMTGRRFTLPTEAEWEYAARGGKKSTNAKYSGSSSVANVAWYDGNSGSQTHPVGRLRANELGIYDMSGNVWEWCFTHPEAEYAGDEPTRGGSYADNKTVCYVNYQRTSEPHERDEYTGFRIVRNRK